MKDCVRFAPMLEAREGELSGDEAAALAAHLEGCDRCRAFQADLAFMTGLLTEHLMAQANTRDFAPFVDQVMARVGLPAEGAAERRERGFLAWFARHRRAALTAALPVVAAAAVLMYVRRDGGTHEVALLEVAAEGQVTMVLQTSDGPVVLLDEEHS